MWPMRLCITVLVSIMSMSGQVNAEGRIVKWVDEKGITHYGDAIPPKYAGRDSSEINSQGRVVKQNKTGVSQANGGATATEAKVNLEQQRRDRALLAAYTTEEEFDLARDRNLQTDEATVQGLQQRMTSIKERLEGNKKTAEKFTKRKKPIPGDVLHDIKTNETEIAKVEAQIKDRKQSMEATRQRFDTDKQRFIELKRDPNAPPPAPKPPAPVSVTPPPEVAAPAAGPAVTPAPVAASPASTPAKPKVKRVVMP